MKTVTEMIPKVVQISAGERMLYALDESGNIRRFSFGEWDKIKDLPATKLEGGVNE